MLKKAARFILYGNYFYGFCTVSLAVEANLQQNIPLNSIYFYLLLYCGTVVFYTYAYIQEKQSASYYNERSKWYVENRNIIRFTQPLLILICVLIAVYFFAKYHAELLNTTVLELLPLAAAVFLALSYYGVSVGPIRVNTRNTGWFKPFAIGFVWAAAVTYVPLLWYQAEQNIAYSFTQINAWFFIKNFMYISLLAILFDIKDYMSDHNRKLKTFVVQMGIRKTIFLIIIPLTILGFLSFVVFAILMHFPAMRIAINSIPFILLVIVAWSMKRHKPIIYYLAVIDGLMLVKAICGITATLLLE